MKLTRRLIILVLVMPRRFRKALMDFTGAKTYEECLSRITIISERIENIAVTCGIPEDCVVCLICNARHTHGYAAKIRKWDGSYHIGYIADAKNNGCKTLHFEDHMGNGNRNAEHDHDTPPPKSKKSIDEATCPSTERYFAMIIISLWWVRIQRRRRSKIKKHSVCRMFMKLKAYKRLRSIYKARKCFAKIPMHNLAHWLRSWIKKWHLQQRIDRENKITDMTITNFEKRCNERNDMTHKLIRDLFNNFIQIKVRLDVACNQYLVKKQFEQKRKLFKEWSYPWQKTQEQIEEERLEKKKEAKKAEMRILKQAKLENSKIHKHNQDRRMKMFRKH